MSSAFDVNTVTISGHLTRDPKLRDVAGGRTVCNIRIAHTERRKSSGGAWTEHPAYFDVTVWNGLATWVAKNLAKGQKVVVAGRLRWREYEVNGSKRQAVDISADSVIPAARDTSSAAAAADVDVAA